KKLWDDRCGSNIKTVANGDSVLNVDVTFGGHKEIVTSKDFKGGNVSTTFGGAEINLMNADSTDKTITLNMRVSFGGIELIVPSHWLIKNEISNTLGSVEDNRNIYTQGGSEEKITLVLTGSCSFGSIEIKSY
ncbi:MAG: cell wall-active antibiotics response protein, partial [Taibaiella sp.]|nr:cell wall-active antibiotics response protein [Taibaiella sp.]